MESNIIDLAVTAGFTLSQVETALLQSLASKGSFDGFEYLRDEQGVDISEDIKYWLPSVWRTDKFYSGLTETDWWDVAQLIYEDHERLYTEAPFPTVSGALFSWLFSMEAVKHFHGIALANIKMAGTVSIEKCEIDYGIQFTECVFENRCSLSGYIEGSLAFTGVYAHYIELSGDFPAGISLNDVQCRGLGGRGPGGALYLSALRCPRLFIYGLFVPNRVVIRDSVITEVEIMGRVLGGDIRAARCEFQTVMATRIPNEQDFNSAFSMSAITIANYCTLNNFSGVSINDGVIGGDLLITELQPSDHLASAYSQDATLRLSSVEVKGTLKVEISPAAYKEQFKERKVHLIFEHVHAYYYQDRLEDLNAIKRLEIEGLEYTELGNGDMGDVDERIKWLTLQPHAPFPFLSWRRVAALLQRHGRFREARYVLIESERYRREALNPSTSARLWSWFLRMSIGYGWELWRIGSLAALLVLFGSVVAWSGMERGLLASTTDVSARVSFSPVVYSLDTALPIIELGHASLWIPTGRGWDGRLVQIYFWIHITIGWLIGTLFVIAFTGIAHETDIK